MYEVVYPLGRTTMVSSMASRLPVLNGKTICGSGHTYQGDEAVAAIIGLLQKQFTGIKFISNSQMPDQASTKEEIAQFQDVLREKGADAVISAMGC